MCSAIVQLCCTYYLYHLVQCVSSDLCTFYLYYFPSPSQILRVLAAPTQLVLATTSHSLPPLKSQWWHSCYGAHGVAPVTAGANIHPSHPRAHIQIYHPLDSSLHLDASFWGTSYQSAFYLPHPQHYSDFSSSMLSALSIKALGSTNCCGTTGVRPYTMFRSR